MTEAKIEGDEIVIRIPIASLPVALSVAFDEAYGEDHGVTIDNISLFAKEIVAELNREEEGGTTLIHLMMDKAAIEAIDQGAAGVSEGT